MIRGAYCRSGLEGDAGQGAKGIQPFPCLLSTYVNGTTRQDIGCRLGMYTDELLAVVESELSSHC